MDESLVTPDKIIPLSIKEEVDEPVSSTYTLLNSLESLETKLKQCFTCHSPILRQQHQKSIVRELEDLKQHIVTQKCNFILFVNPT